MHGQFYVQHLHHLTYFIVSLVDSNILQENPRILAELHQTLAPLDGSLWELKWRATDWCFNQHAYAGNKPPWGDSFVIAKFADNSVISAIIDNATWDSDEEDPRGSWVLHAETATLYSANKHVKYWRVHFYYWEEMDTEVLETEKAVADIIPLHIGWPCHWFILGCRTHSNVSARAFGQTIGDHGLITEIEVFHKITL